MAGTSINRAKPLRSVLYMPGSNARALQKAKDLPADAVILDLEDAVAPESKEDARAQVVEAVKEGGYGGREVIVRVNSVRSPWGEEDIVAIAPVLPDVILVPKINDASEVGQASDLIDKAGGPAGISMWAMMETPLAILNAKEIAAASVEDGCRLQGFVMGTNDIAKEIFCEMTEDRTPLMYSLQTCLLAARAYGLTVLDGVYNDIGNEAGFRAVCEQGSDLGFDGKTLIHPSQLAPCNEIFAPSADEVDWSRKVIAEFGKPENHGLGVLKVDGKMAELLHADIARRVVAVADAIAELETAAKK